MNAKKSALNNNGWILCPSKSFPGKFYYFNVLTGEAVWGISNDEKTSLNKETTNVQKINTKYHGYPEPSTPPEHSTNITPSTNLQESCSYQQTPIFSQPAIFPSSLDQYMPMVWMPIQWPTWYMEPRKPTIDQVTQTVHDSEFTTQASKPLTQRFVNYDQPLVNSSLNKTPKKNSPDTFLSSNGRVKKNFVLSPPKKNVANIFLSGNDRVFKNFVSSTPKNKLSDTFLFSKEDANKNFVFSTPINHTFVSVDHVGQNLSKSVPKNLENSEVETQVKKLDSSDLRLVLVAKRKKLQEEAKDPVEKKKIRLNETPPKKRVTFELNNTYSDTDDMSEMVDNITLDDTKYNRTSVLSPPKPIKTSKTLESTPISQILTPKYIPIKGNTLCCNNSSNKPLYMTNKTTHNIQENTKKNMTTQYDTMNITRKANMTNNMNLTNDMTNDNMDMTNENMDMTNENMDMTNVNVDMTNENVGMTKENLDMTNENLDMTNENIEVMKNVFLMVVGMDVLLDDSAFIENILQSDNKYRLLIPHALRVEIEGLCFGDCRGQQRVLVARQISRRMAMGYKQYIVEPPSEENTDTTDSILNCCLRAISDNYHLVLISNDSHLLSRAKTLNIQCYKPQEIKNGANLHTKTTDLKKIKVTVDNSQTNCFLPSHEPENIWQVNTYKKQLFENSNTDKNCDYLINITKPKSNTPKKIINNSNSSQNEKLPQNLEITKIPNQKSSMFNIKNINNNEKNEIKINTAARNRIEKMINTLNTKTKNPDEIFRIPDLPKSIGRQTSALKQHSSATDMCSNFEKFTEDRLRVFCVKNKIMYNNIKNRMDEWICSYTQIMEELLNYVLQNNLDTNIINVYTTSFHELLTCVKMMFNNKTLRYIIEVLVELFTKCTCEKGKFKLDTTPNDFMKIIGCGVLLVQTLKTILPTTEVLTDSELSLETLINNIEHDDQLLDPDLVRPSVCRSEVNDDECTRTNFSKDRLYIIKYLKKHFKEWSDYDDDEPIELPIQDKDNIKIVRMFGKNINMLKIDNNKSISLIKTATDEHKAEKDGIKLIKLVENDNTHKEINNILRNECNSPILNKGKIMYTRPNVTETAGLNMINNTKSIDEYEKTKEPLDALDYEINPNADNHSEKSMEISEKSKERNNFQTHTNETYEGIISVSNYEDYTRNIDNTKENYGNENYASNDYTDHESTTENYGSENYENDDYANQNKMRNNESTNENYGSENYAKDNYAQRDESTADSGFENDSIYTHSFIKTFLYELSGTFKVIYGFVTNFVEELRGKPMCQDRKNSLHITASRCLQDMIAIIQQLRSIIKRESHEETVLKNLLLRAGVEATSDKRITRYRQIVLKCLEQAQIFKSALKIIICITIEDLDTISNNADSISSSIRYLNIFE